MSREKWREVFDSEFDELQKQVDNAKSLPVDKLTLLPVRQMQLLIKTVAMLEVHLDKMQYELVDIRRRLNDEKSI